MPDAERDDRAYLSGLEKYWVKAQGPKLLGSSNERLIRISGEHWIKYVFPTFLWFALSSVAVFFFYLSAFTDRYPAEVSILILLISFGFFWCVHHWYFWLLLAESESRIIITSKRVLHIRTGLLWDEETVEIAFDKMKTVEMHKTTFLQSILNYGTLQFEPFKINRVPHPGTMVRLIQQSMGMI